MDRFRCEHCNSDNILITQTISSGPVYYICRNCKKETIVNQKLYDELMNTYKKFICDREKQTIQEEQGKIKVYA